MKTYFFLLFTFSICIAGCKFDDLEDQTTPPVQSGETVSTREAPLQPVREEKAVSTMTIKLPGRDPASKMDSVKRLVYENETGKYKIPKLVGLPANVSDALEFELPLPVQVNDKGLQLSIKALKTAGAKQATNLTVSNLKNSYDSATGLTSFRFTVSDISDVLPSDAESIIDAIVTLDSRESKQPVATVKMRLATPPSKIEVQDLFLNDEKTRNVVEITTAKKLENLMIRLDLVHAVRIANRSASPVDMTLPVRINGTLQTHYYRIDVSQARCTHSTARTDWDEVYSNEIYLLPVDSNTSTNYVTFLNDHVSDNSFRKTLASGQEIVVGVYATGPKTKKLITEGPPAQRLTSTAAVIGCRSRCAQVNFGTFQQYWQPKNWPGASKQCQDGCCWINSRQTNEDYCNRCREWEETSGNTDVWGRYCITGWEVEQSRTQISVGTQSHPVILKTDQELNIKARRAELPKEADEQEERNITLLKQQVTVFE